MVIDLITYNGEQDLLDLRLNILNDVVDQFIIVEAPTTFSGKAKPLYFGAQMRDFIKFLPKIKYHVIQEDYTTEEIELAENSPNTKGAHHWKHEFLQKERIKQALTHLKDDDIVFIGDCDEIWNPTYLQEDTTELVNDVSKLSLRVYTYWLNNLSSEQFWGTITGKYKHIKGEVLNHLRSDARKVNGYYGWHFTSMGGYEVVKKKLGDQYTLESYWTPEVQEKLQWNINNKKDFLGRGFTYKIDTSEWPEYLKENMDKYKNLCYNEQTHA